MGKHFFARNIRVKQLKSILEHIKLPPYLPIILAGDFNENALMEQKKFVTILHSRGLTHSLHFEQYEFMPSYRIKNPFVNNWLNRSKYSRRLDYILVSLTEGFDLKVAQYEPMYLIPPLSDHDPVFLSLSSGYE
jgi:endonuclease/exonuclease/phosphatase family metal-dependent hydrolase